MQCFYTTAVYPVKSSENKNESAFLGQKQWIQNLLMGKEVRDNLGDVSEVLEKDFITKPDNSSYNLSKPRQGVDFIYSVQKI